MATYPKKTGITNIDDAVYYREEQMGTLLPPIPEEDGEYTLTLVVEGGVPGLVWEESV